MDTENSASSRLPWIWVIEALARMKEVDISVLTDLVVKTPEVADDVGKDVRDILSLRILEDFQEQQHENLNASVTCPTANVEIGGSTDHEDIFRLLLQKISVFTGRKEESELLMSDLQNYIQNRRCSLPKCTLEQLEVAIQEGHPILESLKDSSRLSTNDPSANITSVTNHKAWNNAVPPEVKQAVHGGRVVSVQGNLDLSQSTSLQDPIKTNNISSRCKGIDPAAKDKFSEHINDRNSPQDEIDPHLRIAKKAKHDDSVRNEATDNLLTVAMVSNELLENVVETGSRMPVVSSVDKLRSEEVDHDLCSGKNNFSKEEDDDPTVVGPSVCSLRDRTEKECVNDGETDGDSDGFDNEKIDIEIRKQRFLSSQYTFSEDTLSTTQKTELSLCIKCNKDGQLLVCSTRTCMIGLHPSCLGYPVSFDDCRQFYCPFCAYSNAISEHREAKKISSLARKSLITSMRFENESQPTIDSRGRPQKKPLESRVDDNQPLEDNHFGSECETEHNWREEQTTKTDGCQEAHTNLCKEMVVYAKQGK